jgi:DNA-binding MarR family transcriptional regulator
MNASDRLAELTAYIGSGQPDLTNRQMALLMTICTVPGPHRIKVLAERLGVRKPIITRALTTLSLLGLAQRRRCDCDRRDVYAEPTERGQQMLLAIGFATVRELAL